MDPDERLEAAELAESAWTHNAVAAVGPVLLILVPVLALARLVRRFLRR